MPSTYTINLGLEKPATGEQAGTWGNTANNSYDYIDTATDGNLAIALSSSSYTLTTSQGADSQGRNKVITFTGTLSANATINIAPQNAKKLYFVQNQTGGGFSLIFQQGTGPTFTLANGYSAIIYCNGAGSGAAIYGVLSDLQVNTLRIATALTLAGSATITIGGAATFNSTITAAGLVTANAGLTVNGAVLTANAGINVGGAALTAYAGATINGATINVGGDGAYDLYYRSVGGPLARIPIGSPGQRLTAVSGGYQWQTPTVPAVPVTSVFGRTGAVGAGAGDYSADMVSYAVDSRVGYSNPGFIASLAWGKITGFTGINGYLQTTFIATRPNINFRNGGSTVANCFDDPPTNSLQLQWNYVSDARLKRNVAALNGGLSIINQLHPVEFEFNGLGGTTEGEHGVSVMAHDLRAVLPKSVTTYQAKLRPEDETLTEFLTFSPHDITYHLVQAVQQLDRAVKELNRRLV